MIRTGIVEVQTSFDLTKIYISLSKKGKFSDTVYEINHVDVGNTYKTCIK